jgi:hypothetical protein
MLGSTTPSIFGSLAPTFHDAASSIVVPCESQASREDPELNPHPHRVVPTAPDQAAPPLLAAARC